MSGRDALGLMAWQVKLFEAVQKEKHKRVSFTTYHRVTGAAELARVSPERNQVV